MDLKNMIYLRFDMGQFSCNNLDFLAPFLYEMDFTYLVLYNINKKSIWGPQSLKRLG